MSLQRIFVAIVFLILFSVYAFLALYPPEKFTSPDETANFFFTKHFADTGSLRVEEPLETIAPLVAPRSIAVQEDALVPGSFVGMDLLYGTIAGVVGDWIILFLTPLISLLAVFVFYLFVKLIFDQRVAMLSAFLLAVHPAFWHYTARGMFHNALFVDLLIFGFYFVARIFIVKVTSQKSLVISYVLAGLFTGGAIAVRTSEVVWLAALLVIIGILFWKRIDWKIGFWVALVAMTLPMIPVLVQNNHLYGSPLTFSYTLGGESAASGDGAISEENIAQRVVGLFGKALFPFGVHWSNIGENIWKYGIWMVWPFALLTIFGLLVFFRRIAHWAWNVLVSEKLIHLEKKQTVYAGLFCFAALYLVIYYGSWMLSDNPIQPSAVTLEQSYLRYWLPIYVFGIPFGAMLVIRGYNIFVRRIQKKIWQTALIGAFVFFVFYFSLSLVVADPLVGLAKIRENTLEYKAIVKQTKKMVESDAVLLTGRSDKVFFPEFPVIAAEIDRDSRVIALRKILEARPVYLHVLRFEDYPAILRKFESFGFSTVLKGPAGEDGLLYRVDRISIKK